MGIARVSIPVASLMAITKTLEKTYTHILKNREIMGLQGDSNSFNQFTELIGLPEIKKLEKRFLSLIELKSRYSY